MSHKVTQNLEIYFVENRDDDLGSAKPTIMTATRARVSHPVMPDRRNHSQHIVVPPWATSVPLSDL